MCEGNGPPHTQLHKSKSAKTTVDKPKPMTWGKAQWHHHREAVGIYLGNIMAKKKKCTISNTIQYKKFKSRDPEEWRWIEWRWGCKVPTLFVDQFWGLHMQFRPPLRFTLHPPLFKL